MRIIILISVLLIGFVGGTYFGFRFAPMEFIYSNAQYKASIHAYKLKLIKSGQIEQLKSVNEIGLNAQLANHGRYLNSNLKWLLPYPYKKEHELSSITHAVNYRLQNPYDGPDLSKPESWKNGAFDSDFVQEVIKEQNEHKKLIEMVLNKYEKHNQ